MGVALQALDEAVNGLELGLDGAELAACQRAADRLSAKLGVAYGDCASSSSSTTSTRPAVVIVRT
jgi:hypothetical protein